MELAYIHFFDNMLFSTAGWQPIWGYVTTILVYFIIEHIKYGLDEEKKNWSKIEEGKWFYEWIQLSRRIVLYSK